MGREIAETIGNAGDIDLDRVVIDPAYRREVLSRLRVSQQLDSGPDAPVAVLAAPGLEA